MKVQKVIHIQCIWKQVNALKLTHPLSHKIFLISFPIPLIFSSLPKISLLTYIIQHEVVPLFCLAVGVKVIKKCGTPGGLWKIRQQVLNGQQGMCLVHQRLQYWHQECIVVSIFYTNHDITGSIDNSKTCKT